MTLGVLVVALAVMFLLSKSIPIFALLVALLVWAVIGMIAGKLVRGRDFGLVGNIVLGFFGNIFGSIIFALLGFWRVYDLPFPIGQALVGVIGSIALIYVMRLVDRNFAR